MGILKKVALADYESSEGHRFEIDLVFESGNPEVVVQVHCGSHKPSPTETDEIIKIVATATGASYNESLNIGGTLASPSEAEALTARFFDKSQKGVVN